MNLVAAKCPYCAGSLQVPDDRDTVKCMYCGADVIVRQAIQLVSGASKSFLELARAASAAGNYSEAYDYFTRILEIEPTNAEAWFGKGTAAGWLSNLKLFRFGEMLVAYQNAVKFSKNESTAEMKAACAHSLNAVATACYNISRGHAIKFIALPDTWAEYLRRCEQINSLYESAHSYSPSDRTIIRNVIQVCEDCINGIIFNDPYNNNASASVFLSDASERYVRAILAVYVEKMRRLDPNYVAPNPQKQIPARCFVATATFANAGHPDVQILRSFRDHLLLKSEVGTAFVKWYYKHGPAVARRIENSKSARVMSFLFVVVPAVCIARVVMRCSRRSGRPGSSGESDF